MKRNITYVNPKVVAVTGGIGSGQSTVCEFLKENGCKLIDVDRKAKQIIQKNKVLQNELKQAFGADIFLKNGQLNRRRLAQIVFNNAARTAQLNKLVHPKMVAEVVEEMESARFSRKFPLIVIDAALVYETSIEQLFDAIIVVYSNLEKRIRRVMKRDGLSRGEVMARIERQIPLEDKKEWGDYVIYNNGNLANLKKQTDKIFEELTSDVRTARKVKV